MKKVIVGLIMAGIIGFYVFHLLNVGKEEKTSTDSQNINKETDPNDKHAERLKKCRDLLENEYPSTPGEVMAVYNELLDIAYGGTMTDDEIASYVQIVRLCYTEAFRAINPEETQLANLKDELSANKKNGIKMVTSKVGPIYILTDADGEETQAYITVTHAMNVSGDVRKYLFCKENGYWKINGWESMQNTVAEE